MDTILILILHLSYVVMYVFEFTMHKIVFSALVHSLILIWILHWQDILAIQLIRVVTSFSPKIIAHRCIEEQQLYQFVLFSTVNYLVFDAYKAVSITTTAAIVFAGVEYQIYR